jgi:hypothetical protein
MDSLCYISDKELISRIFIHVDNGVICNSGLINTGSCSMCLLSHIGHLVMDDSPKLKCEAHQKHELHNRKSTHLSALKLILWSFPPFIISSKYCFSLLLNLFWSRNGTLIRSHLLTFLDCHSFKSHRNYSPGMIGTLHDKNKGMNQGGVSDLWYAFVKIYLLALFII